MAQKPCESSFFIGDDIDRKTLFFGSKRSPDVSAAGDLDTEQSDAILAGLTFEPECTSTVDDSELKDWRIVMSMLELYW
jgi:hypothetical protein